MFLLIQMPRSKHYCIFVNKDCNAIILHNLQYISGHLAKEVQHYYVWLSKNKLPQNEDTEESKSKRESQDIQFSPSSLEIIQRHKKRISAQIYTQLLLKKVSKYLREFHNGQRSETILKIRRRMSKNGYLAQIKTKMNGNSGKHLAIVKKKYEKVEQRALNQTILFSNQLGSHWRH